jgi:hypothetical protein
VAGSWRQLHISVDRQGLIHAQVLTDSSGDDAKTGLEIIKKTRVKLSSVTGDAAYDTVAICDAAVARGAKFVVPPSRSAIVSRRVPRSAEQYVRAWAAAVEGNPSLIQAVLGELSGHLELCNKPLL